MCIRDRGYASYRYLASSDLFPATEDPRLADRLRLRAGGKVLLITTLSADRTDRHKDCLLYTSRCV